MSRLFINSLKENDVVSEVYRIVDKALRPNKNGVLYLQFSLTDRTGAISGRLWNATEDLFRRFVDGDFVRCEGVVQRFQGNLQFIAKKLTKVESSSVDADDFSNGKTVDSAALMKRLSDLLHKINDRRLIDLVDCFLTDDRFVERFSSAYAGVRLHHAYPGGLLEHTVAMLEIARFLGTLYQGTLNSDVLALGVFLHDVGKTVELSEDASAPVYTNEGQALGHALLGIEILNRKIAEVEKLTGEPFDSNTALILKHLILSHHGVAENGAAKTPMCLEAVALHYIDSLDAKLAEFKKYMDDDPNIDSVWTNYISNIDRKLLKTTVLIQDETRN